jgi:hypothetical protein
MILAATLAQQEIINCRKRFLFLAAGRRWGKTATVRNRIIRQTVTHPRFKYWYCAPYYAQCKKEWNLLTRNRVFAKRIQSQSTQPFPYIRLHNGSEIGFRSLNRPESIRSEGLHEVWVDELQDVDEETFVAVIRPLVSDLRGVLGASGQFRGYNWFYKSLYLPGQDPESRSFKSWRFPSSTGLEFLSAAGQQELADARLMLPKALYDQEYDCIPSANEAAVFDPDDIDACIRGEVIKRPRSSFTYIMGLDLGRVVDHTALVVLERESGQVVWAQKWARGMKHQTLAMLAGRVARRYNALPIIDVTGGATGGKRKPDAYVKYYREVMPNAKARWWNPATKTEMVNTLSLAVEQHKVGIPAEYEAGGKGKSAYSEDSLIDELRKYEYERKGTHYDYHAPKGDHDDFTAALLMAWWGKHANWGAAVGDSIGSILA